MVKAKVKISDKQIRVTYRHKLVATVEMELLKRDENAGLLGTADDWSEIYRVRSVLIDHRLKPWLAAFLVDFLPGEGECPTYFSHQDGYSLCDRLHVMLGQYARRYSEEITLADMDASLHIDMVDVSLAVLEGESLSIGLAIGRFDWHDGQRREPGDD